VTGDAKEDYIALHRSAKADLLVSGDPDLTALQAAERERPDPR
jgi:predicted nucleic acid-binding protein